MGLCASLSAIDFQKRNEFGLSGLLIFSDIDIIEDSAEANGLSTGTIQPLIDAGFYGQMNIGQSLHFGMGLRLASIIVATMTWPTVYAELDLWRFSFNMRLGGGFFAGLAGFFPFFLAGDFLIPEASLWFRFSRSRIGFGALSFLPTSSFNAEFFKDFGEDTIKNKRVMLYISYVWSF
ncbi:MAG: hypothetical protein LBC46_01505 [Treponema sp.]|jgi:hypothetical protein|nr:hypothetical protein [Treponema sp.]